LRLTGLDFLFWAAGLAENILLLFVLVYRHRAARFPFFTSLCALAIIRTLTLYWVLHHASDHAYFWTYWSIALLDCALQFCIVYEIAAAVFRPGGVWAPDVRQRFIWLAVPSLAVALGLSLTATPPVRFWMQAVVARSILFTDSIMSELFVLMLALSVSAGLPWKTHVSKIAHGLGTYSMITLIVQAAQSYFGADRKAPMYVLLSHIRIAAYLSCVIYWIVALWAEEEQPALMPEEFRENLLALQSRLAYDLGFLRMRKK
jgi:hypothetical protein